ncbi:hypothetical protein B0H66DRAFT_571609 [Apodospora peruviana]|uniref:Zn(2)-C6 fungal-type domain-containing protein n=1 Tax=Apodospora peruviana TaxID=516989 RepID=A0AAE0IPB4_9PEZI|nr:hypothetical protein B0H66DRAFT_571609 [Apodospora peruviana]
MNNNIKKRRAYCHEDSPAERVLQDLSQSSPHGLDASSLPVDYQYILRQAPSTHVRITVPLSKLLDLGRQEHQNYILGQAASALNVPLSLLLDLSNHQHHLHKRSRLSPTVHMPAPYSDDPVAQDVREKPVPTGPSGHAGNMPRKSFSPLSDAAFPSGWTGSRIADCLANFTMCPPCTTYESQSAYQALPPNTSYNYATSRPSLDDGMVSLHPQGQVSLGAAPITAEQPDMFPCDDPAIVAQYLASYPPLQPTSTIGMQPPPREEMVYPTTSPINRFSNNGEATRGGTGLGIQGQSYDLSPTVGPNVMPVAYSAESTSPTFSRLNGFAALPVSYSPQPGYEIKGDPDDLDGRARSVPFDLFHHQRTLPARRGPFKDNDQREATAKTRKIGSCIRCRMQRIRCNIDPDNEGGPCLACRKITSNSRVYRLSCLRWKITDVKLFKPGQVQGHEWTKRWKDSVVDDIGSWAASELKTIHVTEGYTGKWVKLQVRRFQPQEGDRLERSWVSNGQKKSVKIPPYAIVDMDAAKGAFDEYIKQGLFDCCKRLLGRKEELLWQTYAIAIKTMGEASTNEIERKLLTSTLDLWMSVRLTTKSFEIIGDETLEMPRNLIDDDNNPLHGKIPLPPVMGAQIDSILIHQVQPQLRRNTLEELQKMTQEKKQKTWLITYLVTFILLHNIALITKHDADYARKHGMKRRFAREDNVKEYNLGANTLLAYFHYCNKGIYPFSAECRDQDLQSLAELDDDAISFVRYTRQYASQQKRQWEDMWKRDDYENEYFYVSQLFEQNWQPRTMA